MSRSRSTWLERIFWKPCPYWRGFGNIRLKGQLAGNLDSDFCTTCTLKHRCGYGDAKTLTEEQVRGIDEAYHKALGRAYAKISVDGYAFYPRNLWLRRAGSSGNEEECEQ